MVKNKGFTLIEILIVIVIIAILAALLIPRLVPQSERGMMAEAHQMLGTLMRAQATQMDLSNSSQGLCMGFGCAEEEENYAKLGISEPKSPNFNYTCTTTECKATRQGGGAYSGGTITLDYINGVFTCGSPYQSISPDRGCTTGSAKTPK